MLDSRPVAGVTEEAPVVRRIVEEDVSTPTTTVVDSDGSWVGRTIVALALIAVLVLGAIWLFNNVGDGDGAGDNRETENNINVDEPEVNVDADTDGDAPAPEQS